MKKVKVLKCESYGQFVRMWCWCIFVFLESDGRFDYHLNHKAEEILLIQYEG